MNIYNDYRDIEDAMADVRAALDELDAKDAEIERLEAVAEAARAITWVFDCRCDEAYTSRGKHEPNAICGEDEDLRDALAALDRGQA